MNPNDGFNKFLAITMHERLNYCLYKMGTQEKKPRANPEAP